MPASPGLRKRSPREELVFEENKKNPKLTRNNKMYTRNQTYPQTPKPHDTVSAWVNELSKKMQPERSVKSFPQSSSLPRCTRLQLEKELSCRNITLLGWFPVHILQCRKHWNFDTQWDQARMPSKTVKEILSTTFPKELLCTSFNLFQASQSSVGTHRVTCNFSSSLVQLKCQQQWQRSVTSAFAGDREKPEQSLPEEEGSASLPKQHRGCSPCHLRVSVRALPWARHREHEGRWILSAHHIPEGCSLCMQTST